MKPDKKDLLPELTQIYTQLGGAQRQELLRYARWLNKVDQPDPIVTANGSLNAATIFGAGWANQTVDDLQTWGQEKAGRIKSIPFILIAQQGGWAYEASVAPRRVSMEDPGRTAITLGATAAYLVRRWKAGQDNGCLEYGSDEFDRVFTFFSCDKRISAILAQQAQWSSPVEELTAAAIFGANWPEIHASCLLTYLRRYANGPDRRGVVQGIRAVVKDESIAEGWQGRLRDIDRAVQTHAEMNGLGPGLRQTLHRFFGHPVPDDLKERIGQLEARVQQLEARLDGH